MTPVKRTPPAIFEIIFDLCYLIFAVSAGIILLLRANSELPAMLYGTLALVLGFGDAFHLLPRVFCLWTGTMRTHARALGFGKFVTSITMTIFYVLLYYVWRALYPAASTPLLTALVLVLAAVRILLCLCPQNRWLSAEGAPRMAIYRNVPFAILGAVLAVLFAIRGAQDGFAWMPLAIVLSFVFYFIVVLFAGRYPKTGMFMLPKTCVYIWMLCMGFSLLA